MTAAYHTVRYASLGGRHILITGGASGIGGEMVKAFAAQEARVHFIDVDEAAGAEMTGMTGATFRRCDRDRHRRGCAR